MAGDPDDTATYRGDAPIAGADDDLLGRGAFATRVADTIRGRPDAAGLVVGVFGAWGEGKTSVLHMIAERLTTAGEPSSGAPPSADGPTGGVSGNGGDDASGPATGARDVAVLWFNPWYFRGEDHLVRAFFRELAGTLGRRLATRAETIGTQLKRYGAVVAELTPSALGVNPGKAAVAAASAIGEPSIDDLRRRVEDALDAAAVQVVVFVDDVDRLDRDEVHAVLKLVKLTAGFRHVTYVLAFDDEMVAAALGEWYAPPGESGSTSLGERSVRAGRSFLEKIVQVPLALPPADPATLLHLALDDVDRALAGATVTEREVQEFRRYFDPLFHQRRRTLRAGKRYANQLTFALPLLRGEVRIGDLLLLEAVRAFYPDVYAGLLPNRDLLTEMPDAGRRGDLVSEERKRRWEAIAAAVSADERGPLQDVLVHLFPRLAGVVGNTNYGSDWDEAWAREQRVASSEYIARYFRYAVPADDVSDVAFSALRSALTSGDAAATTAHFTALATPAAAERLVQKLRRVARTLARTEAETLVRVVAAVGGALPNPRAFFSWSLPFTQAAILIRQALRRVPQPDRDMLALAVLRDAPDVAFVVECYRWLRPTEEEEQHARVLSEAGEQAIRLMITERLREAARKRPFYLDEGEGPRALLRAWLWYVGAPEVPDVLRARFDADPAEAALLLLAATNPSWSMETGLPSHARLARGEYDFLAGLMPPGDLLGYLGRVFPSVRAIDGAGADATGAPQAGVDQDSSPDEGEERDEEEVDGERAAVDPNGTLRAEQRRLAVRLAHRFAQLHDVVRRRAAAVALASSSAEDSPTDRAGGDPSPS